MATSEMATLGLEYGQGAIGSWKLAIGVEEVELVSVERRWTERLFWQSRRTATTELMDMDRRRSSEVTREVVSLPLGRWSTETEVGWSRSTWGEIRHTCGKLEMHLGCYCLMLPTLLFY